MVASAVSDAGHREVSGLQLPVASLFVDAIWRTASSNLLETGNWKLVNGNWNYPRAALVK
jgi:hypothetical protein